MSLGRENIRTILKNLKRLLSYMPGMAASAGTVARSNLPGELSQQTWKLQTRSARAKKK